MAPIDEGRFTFLLNPIKDLTKNWQIDLSKFLEQYLNELASTDVVLNAAECGEHGDAPLVMNFAEAAMLLQGSAGVYSRKVELLWSLVRQMLDMLANKRSQLSSRNKAGHSLDDEVNTSLQFEPITEMPTCKKRFREDTLNNGVVVDSALGFLPVTPVCLVDKQCTDKSQIPVMSTSGELLANKHDFRLNYITCGETGMLCTEVDIESMLRSHTRPVFIPTHNADMSVSRHLDTSCMTAQGGGVGEEDVISSSATSCPEQEPVDVFPSPPATPEHANLSVSTTATPRTDTATATANDNDGLLVRRRAVAITTSCPLTPPVDAGDSGISWRDAWRPLDLYDDATSSSAAGGRQKLRPLRRGRITKPPPCLCLQQDNKKRKRTRNEDTGAAGDEHTDRAVSQRSDRLALSELVRQYVFPGASERLKQLMSGKMCPAGGRLTRRQLARLKKQLREEAAQHVLWLQHQREQQQQQELSDAPISGEVGDDVTNDDIQSEAGMDSGGVACCEDDDAVAAPFPAAPHCNERLLVVENNCGRGGDEMAAGGGGDNSYVDLVQRRVAEYLSAAQQYVQSTELSRRVARWQQLVRPRLDREATRAHFDIHQYGSRLIRRLQQRGDGSDGDCGASSGRSVKFADAVRGEPPDEVARYLLSSLMLANSLNIRLHFDEPSSQQQQQHKAAVQQEPVSVQCQPVDAVCLTLLSTHRHHDVFDQPQDSTDTATDTVSLTAPSSRRRRNNNGNVDASDNVDTSQQQHSTANVTARRNKTTTTTRAVKKAKSRAK